MFTDVIIAFSIVTAVGLVAGVLLALASHFLFVKEDETYVSVRACLPGVNCGACGYAGCDDYAKAIAEGTAKTNLCIPGADAVSKEISEILGTDFEDVVEMIAFVRCNGNESATSKINVYDGIMSCMAASSVYGGPNACNYGCLGCGDCAKACPSGAICVMEGIVRVKRDVCTGCGLCAETCPKGIIEIIPQTATVAVACSSKDKGGVARKKCSNACIGCKKCELNCPEKAITVQDNLAKIDYSKCTGCGICAENCPTKCIKTLEKIG